MIKQEWKTNLRALVVGGAGFVGSHLLELTKEREEYCSLSLAKCKVMYRSCPKANLIGAM